MDNRLLSERVTFGKCFYVGTNTPVNDWKYYSCGGMYGVAVKQGGALRPVALRSGRPLLFDSPEEIPPVMQAFAVLTGKGGKRRGRR